MFRRLMTFDEAKRVISEQLKLEVLGEEDIPLLDAYDRVLRENVVSALDIPPFNRSTVDGYAVKAEDTFGAEENQPTKLTTRGMVSVGEPPKISISKGEASAFVLALASRVYLAMVAARCSGGSVPLSRCSINASRTRQKCCSWVVLRVSGI